MNDISHVFQLVNDIKDIQPFILDIYTTVKLIYSSKLYKSYILRNNIQINLIRTISDNFKVNLYINSYIIYFNLLYYKYNIILYYLLNYLFIKVALDVNYKNIELSSFNTQEEKPIQILKYFKILKDNIDNFQSVNTSRTNNINLIKLISSVYFNNAIKYLPNVRKDTKDGQLEYQFNDLFEIFKFLKVIHEKANYSS